MKQILCILCALLLFSLAACVPAADIPPEPTVATEPSTAPVIQETKEPTQPPTYPENTEPTETQPTETTEPPLPPAAISVPGVSVEDMILYFNEVCLDGEYVSAGDPSVVQKWAAPILFWVYGDPTEEDLTVLFEFADHLNEIEGFPGIREAEAEFDANLRIYFCSQQELIDRMDFGGEEQHLDGAVTFWYDNNEIYDAIICIRTDLTQSVRNPIILEEIYNGLGPVQDTVLRADSLVYQYDSETQAPTAVDLAILRLLYHTDMRCGMDAAACEEVIRRLYG